VALGDRSRGRFVKRASAAALCGIVLGVGLPASAQSLRDLQAMSISDLANIDVTSVSKRREPVSDAPAAVFVITHDEILRSGAVSIPEILRLAPNLQVARISASSYAITARGFNGNAANKLLVLIDGRSVYTPLFGGVLWDEQDVPVENIKRIEVISGPGATMWGANAVNGVINIITMKAADTQGGVIDLTVGNRESHATLQYGGNIGSDLAYRLHLSGLRVRDDRTSAGEDADNGWHKAQGGFRLDWTPGGDRISFAGRLYRGSEQQADAPRLRISGGTVRLGWTHASSDGGSLQLSVYHDESKQASDAATIYSLKTDNLDFQHSFSLGDRHQIIWGAGVRVYRDHFDNPGLVNYLPPDRTRVLANIFAQDTVALTSSLDFVLGLKIEKDPYSGVTPLPSARLGWKVNDDILLWAAISRAVRAPTRFDVDLHDEIIPSVLILTGDRDFKNEKLIAYEAGTRIQIGDTASLSISGYYNSYDDLRSVEWVRMDALPLLWRWGNMLEGHIYGLEAWGDYRPAPWWRLKAGFNIQHQALHFKPGASNLNSLAAAGNDPDGQASLHSSMDLGHGVSWTTSLRYVAALPDPHVPAYVEADSSLSWAATRGLRFSLSGFNLLHARHVEYKQAGATIGNEVRRSISVGAHVRF